MTPQQLDRTYHFIMSCFVRTGQAPHYTEIAREFSVSPDEGKELLHDLMDHTPIPMWLYPGTDLIASFAPFNNLPTQYRVTIDGHQRWFAQWGFEALAVCWVFPGQAVRIDAPCLDCGDAMRVVVRDGVIEDASPPTIQSYVDVPFGRWAKDWPFTWSRIHLFRSEEHAKSWSGFRAGTEEAILPLADVMAILGTPRHSARLNGTYVSSSPGYAPAFLERLRQVTRDASFWKPEAR